jgi:transposase
MTSVEEASLRLRLDTMLNNARGPGRPPNNPADLAKVLLMQQYFCVSNRQAQGLTQLFAEKMRLEKTFSYKTIERAYEDPLVTLVLKEVFKLTGEPVRGREHIFAPDGTGLSTSIKHNYESDARSGSGKAKKGYEKMVAMTGCTYKLFSAVQIAENPTDNESPYFETLLAETAARYERIDVVPADSAYLSRRNCELIAGVGATPRIYPKQGITLRKKGSRAWTEMLLNFIDDPQQWLRDYHTRSLTESAHSALKRDFPIPLRKRIRLRRKQEAYTRTCDYNLKRLSYLRHIKGISATKTWST